MTQITAFGTRNAAPLRFAGSAADKKTVNDVLDSILSKVETGVTYKG